MELERFLAHLKKIFIAEMLITLTLETIYGILSIKEGFMILPPPLWTILRYGVLIGTVSGIILIILQPSGRKHLQKLHWYSLLAGGFSILFFILPATFVSMVLNYLGALLSCLYFLRTEFLRFKQSRAARRRNSIRRVSTHNAQRNRRDQPVALAQQQAVPTASQPSRRPAASTIAQQPRRSVTSAASQQSRRPAAPATSQPSRRIESSTSNNVPTILIFHCNEDRLWLKKCYDQLGIFEALDLVALWDENKIAPGSIHEEEVGQALSSAKVVILLVSGRFLHRRFSQLHRILRYQESRQHFWIYPVIVSECLYSENPLLGHFSPYYSIGNTRKRSLDQLPVAKQKESFRDLARLIARQLGLSTHNGTHTSLHPNQPILHEERRLQTSHQVSPQNASWHKATDKVPHEDNAVTNVFPMCITEEDKMVFSQVKPLLESTGLLSHTYHTQFTNGEYLRHLQKIMESTTTTAKRVEWARDTMKMIIERAC